MHPTPVQKPHQIRKSAASCCVGVGRHCSEGEEVLNIIKKIPGQRQLGYEKSSSSLNSLQTVEKRRQLANDGGRGA